MGKVEISLEEYEALKKQITDLERDLACSKNICDDYREILKVLTPYPLNSGIINDLKPYMVNLMIDNCPEKCAKMIRISYELPNMKMR